MMHICFLDSSGPLEHVSVSVSLPVRTHTDVPHVKLDGFGLFLVLEMIICEEVVHLIHQWGRWRRSLWKSRHLPRNTRPSERMTIC